MKIYKKEVRRLLLVLCWLILVLIATYFFWKTKDFEDWNFALCFLPIATLSILWIPLLWFVIEVCISPIIFICKDRKWVKHTFLYTLLTDCDIRR